MEEIAGNVFVVSVLLVTNALQAGLTANVDTPDFKGSVSNITIAIGREAILECTVENLDQYKVAWLKVDTQTILTIHNHVITKNNRIAVSHTELNVWHLHVKEVRKSDQGWYMCQINTDPMKSEAGYLHVVVPPDILDYPTSTDMVVDEGANVSLQCIAKGSPTPLITWKREDGEAIHLQNGSEVLSINGSILNITSVNRDHMGPYLCIASNGVPPSVSKRIKLVVQFSPTVWIRYQLIGAYDGQQITLDCYSQAFPTSINYWTKDQGDIIPQNIKYVSEIREKGYKVHMQLKINSLEENDYGIYKCISRNSLGDMEGSINVYRIPDPDQLLPIKKQNTRNTSYTILTPHTLVGEDALNNYVNDTLFRSIDDGHLDLQGYYSSGHRICNFELLYTCIFIYISSIYMYHNNIC